MSAFESNKKTIYFISHSTYPVANTGGGSIVLYRHLKRLEKDGYKIVFIHSIQNPPSTSKTEFEEILIKRRKWYPPLRPHTPLLTNVRISFYFKYLKKLIKPKPGDLILSTFGDYTNLLALKLSVRFKLPLFMIYHDDNLFNTYFNENLLSKPAVKKIIRQTKHFFAVSEPMKDLLLQNGASSVSVLYPIPDGYTGKKKAWTDTYTSDSSFYNSGAIFEDFHSGLIQNIANAAEKARINISLLGRLSSTFKKRLEQFHSLRIGGRVEKTEDLFKQLIIKADVLLVFYSFEPNKEQRLFHSFPSKFAEYSHLGIPILIIAPSYSAIGKWAIKNNWYSYLSTDNVEDLYKIMIRFRDEYFWEACHRQSLQVAQDFFDPDKIHLQFVETLLN